MTNRFRKFAVADQIRIIQRIQTLRDSLNAIEPASDAVPDQPDPGSPTANAFLESLRNLHGAQQQVEQACIEVRNERMLRPQPDATVTGLNSIIAQYRQTAADTQEIIVFFQGAVQEAVWGKEHPAGTPDPTTRPPAADGAVQEQSIPPPPTDAWLGAFRLAKGGQATPAVYVRQNRHGQIMDRACIKDTAWPRSEGSVTPSLYDPDHTALDASSRSKRPAEVGALIRLNELPGSQSIIKLRNWHRIYHEDARTVVKYRLYLEWCGYGDLYQLSRKYTPYDAVRGYEPPDTVEEEDWIPEPFVWACAEQLVNAGILMERGTFEKPPVPPWSEIIHRDLKTPNVFLAHNTSNIYKGYPALKIGDFGMATILSTDSAKRYAPNRYLRTGTDFCTAPEQLRLKADGTLEISSKTNVWGIGIVLWSLLHSRAGGDFAIYDPTPLTQGQSFHFPRDPQTATFSAKHGDHYSQELRDFILDCLTLSPDDRPNFDALAVRVRQATNRLSETAVDRAAGLRDADGDDPRFAGDSYALKLSEERYAMYSFLSRSMDPAPRPDRGNCGEACVQEGEYTKMVGADVDHEHDEEEEQQGQQEQRKGNDNRATDSRPHIDVAGQS
ncbi:hypothetical protein CBER1_05727 [Cercospora berteroae]|uniref:non-specific serine/threonine protein kinase n=1 Tax=Cercospora berteroae TaxID=357750 RepID=A0A2S6BT11_9PEZI|nr:hypothetical protein CBER1_05727 [Cercospora berteroae]